MVCIILKLTSNRHDVSVGTGTGCGLMAGYRERDNEPSDSFTCGEFI